MHKPDKITMNTYYGFQHPFCKIGMLVRGDLKRYVNREKELRSLEVTLTETKENCAIFGDQGSGKSSFLQMLKQRVNEQSYTVFLSLTLATDKSAAYNEIHFLKTLVEELIQMIEGNKKLVMDIGQEKLNREKTRLNYTSNYSYITEHTTIDEKETKAKLALYFAELGGALKQQGGIKKIKQTMDFLTLHDAQTLKESLNFFVKKLDKDLVVFVDELDKISRYPFTDETKNPSGEDELLRTLELSRDLMANSKLTFAFALQEGIYPRFKNALRGSNGPSLLGLIPDFEYIKPFDLDLLEKTVVQNLKIAGYTADPKQLFAEGVLEHTRVTQEGNPRTIMKALRDMLKKNYLDEGENKTITLSFCKHYLEELFRE